MIIISEPRPELLRFETLAEIFTASVANFSDRVALIDGQQSLSYSALGAAAERVARNLAASGEQAGNIIRENVFEVRSLKGEVEKPRDTTSAAFTQGMNTLSVRSPSDQTLNAALRIIGLWLPRGADLLIAQAGITLSGAAWLPFDADAPPERVAACLRDAGAIALITTRAMAAQLPASLSVQIHEIADLLVEATATAMPALELTPDHPAYVIYTSGSTGTPKGIAVSHRAICHFLRSENAVLGVTAEDRVFQGFSVSFDMSFEEIWISYLVGACLWLAPKAVTSDPDALLAVLCAQRITVLHAVPSLVALLPEIPEDLRLVNLGGEACPQAVADRWATGGRRVFNTYGPTETAVSSTYAVLQAGQSVTIGRPLPNYGLAIVDEHFRLVPAGQAGELCVFGPGLALGYVNNSALTRERFVEQPFPEHPAITRAYRSGDQVQVDERGDLRFLGRIDDQVKVRGFRVELGEVESVLAACPGVRAAAVVLRGDTLVAFVLSDDDDDPESRLRRACAAILPAYMVPSRILLRDILPRLASGKVDRRALAAEELSVMSAEVGDEPATPGERALATALREIFPGRAFRRADDFFDDLGGHSLLVARLVSRLRELGFPQAAVRDVYGHRRVGALAQELESVGEKIAPSISMAIPTAQRPARWRRLMGGIIQTLILPVPICLHLATWLAPFFIYHWLTGDEEDSIAVAVVWSVAVFLVAQLIPFFLTIMAKWLVLGRLRPGRYAQWGQVHLRWWFVETMAAAVPVWLLNGTPYYRLWLRMLGARIGSDVYIGNVDVQAPDLLSIGDGAAIGSSVTIANVRVTGGHLVVRPVTIGARAMVDSYVVLEGGCSVGADATLGPLSSLAADVAMPDGAHWQGAPARPSHEAAARAPYPFRRPGWLVRLWEWMFFPLAGAGVSVLFFLPIFPAFMLIDWVDAQWLDTWDETVHTVFAALSYLTLGLPAGVVLVTVTLVVAALLRRIVLPHLKPGSWSIHGSTYYRKWITSQVQESSLHLLHGLFATVYAPWWFRLMGARVGRNTEISTALGVTPELLELGDDSFVADGAMLGDELVRDGWMTVRGTRVGSRTFIGNGASVPDGAVLPSDVLIGVLSLTPPNQRLASGQTWMGSPALLLPARETLSGFPDHLTFRPSPVRRCARGIIEMIRIVLPLACVMAFGYLAVRTVMPFFEEEEWMSGFLALTVAGLLFGHVCLLGVLAAKWLLIGRYRPRAAPMWTLFVWISEAITTVYESLVVPNLLIFLRGTPMLPIYLRLFGAHIGRDVYLDTTDFTEFDCVTIGDGAVLDGNCGPQTHLFEDRIMKIGTVRIGADVEVGACSTILYDTELGDGVRVAALTLVAKGERLPAGTAWEGSPAAPMRA